MSRALIILIVLLAFFVRLFNVSTNPPSLYWDEIAIGYNAKSIAATGADEYGQKLPPFFESFGEYKLPGYIYLDVPFINWFGLNALGIRFPSVILGTLGILFTYLIVSSILNRNIALLSAFLLAISPWHIQFSRAGFEANVALTVFLFGLFLLIKGLHNIRFFLLGTFVSILSAYFYNTYRIFIPLFFIVFIILYRNKLINYKKHIVASTFIMLVFFFPLIKPSSLNRFSFVGIVSDPTVLDASLTEKSFDKNNLLARLVHHRDVVYADIFIKNYMLHFSPNFLLFNDEANARHHVTETGYLYLWQFPFLIYGLYVLFKSRHDSLRILLPWFLLAPVASALALPAPHGLRSLTIVPALSILSAVGIICFFQNYPKIIKTSSAALLALFLIFTLVHYLHQLLVHYPYESAGSWAYGYRQIYEKVDKLKNKYNDVYITGSFWRPYIFALFYLNYPPSKYQENVSHNRIDNIYFGYAGYDSSDSHYDYHSMKNINNNPRSLSHSLLVLTPGDIKLTDTVIDTIADISGKPLFKFVETK